MPDGPLRYLTTEDKMWEISWENEWRVAPHFTIYGSLSYLDMNLAESAWGNALKAHRRAGFAAALSFRLYF